MGDTEAVSVWSEVAIRGLLPTLWIRAIAGMATDGVCPVKLIQAPIIPLTLTVLLEANETALSIRRRTNVGKPV